MPTENIFKGEKGCSYAVKDKLNAINENGKTKFLWVKIIH